MFSGLPNVVGVVVDLIVEFLSKLDLREKERNQREGGRQAQTGDSGLSLALRSSWNRKVVNTITKITSTIHRNRRDDSNWSARVFAG